MFDMESADLHELVDVLERYSAPEYEESQVATAELIAIEATRQFATRRVDSTMVLTRHSRGQGRRFAGDGTLSSCLDVNCRVLS